MDEIAVVGIGNPFRGDDGAGWAVLEALQERLKPPAKLFKIRGDVSEIIDIFSKYPKVFLIDACQGGIEKGKWMRIDARAESLPGDHPQTSTHGMGISQAVALAENLGLLPSLLILYAIAGERFGMTAGLSPSVSAAVVAVTEALLKEEAIHPCTNTT